MFWMLCSYGFTEPIKKIVIFPFHIQAESDPSFIREGIESMIFSRLSSLQTLSFIEGPKIYENSTFSYSKAMEFGKKSDANFIITGNIIIIGDKVSTDIQLTDVTTGNRELSFSKLGEKKEIIINHIDLFCKEIVSHFTQNGLPYTPEISIQNQNNKKTFTLLKSRSFDYKIIGLTTFNFAEKSKSIAIISDETSIYAYNNIFENPIQLFKHTEKGNTRILSIDAADMDKDGSIEIYVTAIYENSGDLKSFILEWQDDKIQNTAINQKWFFRIINPTHEKQMLIGQKRGKGQILFKPGIYEMAWKNRTIVQGKKIKTPNKMVIFGFTMGDIFNTGKKCLISLNKDGYLSVYDETGERIWISPEIFGGTENHITYDPAVSPDDRFYFYLPQRVYIADMDQNGQNDLIISSNHEMTGHLFSRMRYFDKGMIEFLTWNDIGFVTNYKTQETSGYISDFAVGDFNGNGVTDILFAVVAGGNSIFGKKTSFLVLWEKSL